MRLVVLCDFGSAGATALVAAILDEAARRPGWSVVGLCDAGRGRRSMARSARRIARAARRAGATVVRPPTRSVNDAATVAAIAGLAPDLGLAVHCPQVFGAELRSTLPVAVNLHDAALPDHAGLSATSFSLYEGDQVSGFTWHLVDAGIDTGRVLVRGAVPVTDHDDLRALQARKSAAAAAALPEVLDRVTQGHPGTPQVGARRYHSRDDTLRLIHVADASTIGTGELRRRLRAFGAVELPTGAGRVWVTALGPPRPGRPVAELADGTVHVSRVAGIPAVTYRLGRWVRRRARGLS